MTVNWISKGCIPALALATLVWTTVAAGQGQPMMPMMPMGQPMMPMVPGAPRSRPLQPMEMLNLSDEQRAQLAAIRTDTDNAGVNS